MQERKPKKRFYWLEGVSRNEVEHSLADRRPSRWRQQGPRRQLVIAAVVVLLATCLTVLIPQPKVASYLGFASLAISIWLYLKLRSSVRQVSEAPDELLDEWQIAARNAAYVGAYRWLAQVAIVHLIFVVPALDEDARVMVNIGFVMLAVSLPTLVLAWRVPSEPSE